MDKIALIAWITFKDSIRSKVLYGIVFLVLLLLGANIIVSSVFTWELGKVAVDMGLSVVSISGLIIIFFFGIHMVSNDLQQKTVYLILSRPVDKYQYIIGKYLGLGLVILISSATLGVCAMASVKIAAWGGPVFMPANFNWVTLILGLGYLTLSLMLVLAMAFLCLSVTSHHFTAVLLCAGVYFIGQNVENVVNIISRSPAYADNPVLLKLIRAVSWVFPNLAAFDLKTTAAYGLPMDGAYLAWTAVYGVTYIGVCLTATALIFQRRELA